MPVSLLLGTDGLHRTLQVASERDRQDWPVEVIDNATDFAALREEWSELLRSSTSDCIFLTWEWLFTWWKHLGGDRALSILAVRSPEGQLVAIAPLSMNSRRLGSALPMRTLEFLGTGTVSSDHLDIIVRSGCEGNAINALAEHLVRQRRVVKLIHFNQCSSFTSKLAAELQRRGWTAEEKTLVRAPVIKLSGHAWESYLDSLNSDFRHQLRRRLRKLQKDFDVQLYHVETEEQRARAMSLLFTLHDLRWRDRGGSKAFHTPALRAFHEEVSRLALERGWLRLLVQSLDGQPAVARYGFRYGKTYSSYQSGFDPAYSRHWIGILSLVLTIKSSLEEDAAEHDLLAGNEEYKSRLASDAYDLGQLELYPPSARWFVYRRALTLYRALQRTARRVFHPSA